MISVLFLMLVQDPVQPVSTGAGAEVAVGTAALPVRLVQPVETHSEAGLAQGHAGSVFLEVDVQPDGSRGEIRVAESSRSEILDAEAVSLVAGATLRPPETATRYRIEVKFDPYGFLGMTCGSLVRQTRWFEATWPERSIEDTTLYTASVGVIAMAVMGGAGATEALRAPDRVEAAWPRLVQECERQPDRPYVQVLGRLVR